MNETIDIALLEHITERGNTLLTSPSGGMVFVSEVKRDVFLIVTYMPDNYPSVNIAMERKTHTEIVETIRSNYGVWEVIKNNLW